MNSSSYFIIGGYFAEQLNYQLEKKINNKGIVFQFPSDYKNAECYIRDLTEKLSNQLSEDPIDYLILELRSLLDLIEPETFDQSEVYGQVDSLIDTISGFQISGKVFIIESYIPRYYIMDDILLKELRKKEENHSSLKLLNKIEKYVQKKTQGVLINTASFYFFRKKRGYQINNRLYEKECYIDICSKIVQHAKSGKVIKKIPNTRQSLNRYIKYGNRTIAFDALQVFLNPDIPFSCFVLSSPNDFVENYKKEFLQLKDIKCKDYLSWRIEAKSCLIDSPSFYNIASAFYSLFFDIYDDSVSYSELFKNEIVSQKTRNKIQEYVAENNIVSPKQVNCHNAGYYFALMNGLSSEEAMHFVRENSVIKPDLVDVFGSCVSRTCLREMYSGNTTLAANNYWFQIPPYSDKQSKISYDPSIFNGLKGVQNYNTKIQFEHRVSESIMQSDASWIIIDLYGLIAPCTYEYKGLYYTDLSGKLSQTLGVEKINAFDNPFTFSNEENLMSSLEPWCDTLLKKYNDQIILMSINYSALSKGDDNEIYCPRNQKKKSIINNLLQKAYKYTKEKLNCYCVEFTHGFCPDDRGYKERVSVHYSYDFYSQAYKQIDYIVSNKPAKKYYDLVDPEIRMKRLADYVEKNDKDTVSLFFNNPLDQVVMNLPSFVIRDNIMLLASWYQSGFKSLDDIMENWQNDWDSDLKQYVLLSDKKDITKEIFNQKDYSEEPYLNKHYQYRNPIPLIGRRGYMGKYPQNSIPAFIGAYENDFDGIAIDLWEAFNGDLMIAHNASMDKVFGQNMSIRELNNVTRWSFPMVSGKRIKSFKSLYAPTLEEVLCLFSGKPFSVYIHINNMKDGSYDFNPDCAERIIRLVHKYKMEEQVLVFSAKYSILGYFKGRGIHLGKLSGKYGITDGKKDVKKLKKIGADTLIFKETDIINQPDMGGDFIQYCHQHGVRVGSFHTRTVDDYKYLISAGADFSIADYQMTELMEREPNISSVIENKPGSGMI